MTRFGVKLSMLVASFGLFVILPSTVNCGKRDAKTTTGFTIASSSGSSDTTSTPRADSEVEGTVQQPTIPATPVVAASSSVSSGTPSPSEPNQSPDVFFDGNQIRYASMQNETWSFYSGGSDGPGTQQTVTGSVLVMSSDPNACSVSKAGTVTADTFTVKILSADFVRALTDTGRWPDPGNNTWAYPWRVMPGQENVSGQLWCADCNIGSRLGSGHFVILSTDQNTMVEAGYPGQEQEQIVSIPLVTCSGGLVAPSIDQAISGNRLCPPIHCAR